MEPVFAIAGAAVAVAAAVALLLIMAARRRRASGAAGGPGAGDPAWISRITDRIPMGRKHDEDGTAKAQGRSGLGLQGNLGQTPLHDLLQYLALGRKSGSLELASGRRTGRISLSEGRIARAAYRGKEGIEAAFLMMDLAEGDFEFYEQEGGQGAAASSLEVVDVIMLWMARKPRKKQASTGLG